MFRIIIADDHAIARTGIKLLLQAEYLSVYIEEAATAEALLEKVMTASWDLIITDLSMPGNDGLNIVSQLKKHDPNLPVLVLSGHSEEHYAVKALKAGASGYVNKGLLGDELLKAIRITLQGKKYMNANITDMVIDDLAHRIRQPSHELLSERELQFFKLLALGKPQPEIAAQMQVHVKTVGSFREKIMVKMNFKTNADLTRYAIEHKLI
jgi:two-component system invasion response regulator UvrY